MKIKLDENIANRVARAIVEITKNREGYEVSFVRHGDGAPDPDWMKKFAEDGGTAIITGDDKILQHWPNLIAYTESGLVSFFPPSTWERMGAFGKAGFILRWWPAIIEKIKLSSPGDRWRMKNIWTQIDHAQFEPLKDPRVDGPPDPDQGITSDQFEKQTDLFPKPGAT